jgi:glycosyltransferase involved in cell wall biosynthesis
MAYEMSKALVKRGHQVTVYTTNALIEDKLFTPKKGTFHINDIEVHYCRNLVYKPRFHMFYSHELVKKVKETLAEFDVIHLHEYRFYISAVVAYFAEKNHIPLVIQPHGQLSYNGGSRKLKIAFDKFGGHTILKKASKIIALNEAEVEQCKRIGIAKEKITIVPNGLDLTEYTDLPSRGSFKGKFNIPADKKVVLYLGRINETKGIDLLIRAYSNIIKDGFIDALLVIVGPDDGFLRELQSLIKTLKIEKNILIVGSLFGRDKLAAYVDADVYVLPSRYEMFPLTVLEAMACGTPIILSKKCDSAEVVRNKTGLVVNPNPTDIENALLRILTDEQLQMTLRENCRHTIKQFDLANTVSKIERIYGDLVNN